MKKARLLGAAMAACFVLGAGGAQAASVTLTGWAYGNGYAATGSMGLSSLAGGFGGTLADAGSFDNLSFLTYCIELEEHFSFSSNAMTGYAVVDGASYFQSRQLANASRPNGALVADRLGRLLTYVADNPTMVDSALESAAMQLAVWNIVYDTDSSVAAVSGGYFQLDTESSKKHGSRVSALLAGAAGVSERRFDVYALTRSGTQDFLLARPTDTAVPEPGSFALAGLALLGLTAASRRRAVLVND